jgi:hypothetical protein
MPIHELRDPDIARDYCVQGLWLQRVLPPRAELVPQVLGWALEIAGSGEPLPPLGLIADVGHAIFQPEAGPRQEALHVPGWPEGLARVYEDHVLGKLYADSSFERAGDALRRYQGRDRSRGLAFLLDQFRQRAGFGGVHLSPAILKALRDRAPDQLLAQGWESLSQLGPLPLLPELYEDLVTRVRNASAVLGPEDVFELEHGTALAAFSQRLALRQVLGAAAALEERLPHQRLRPLPRRHEVPTHILDEDTYPVGGFVSISNRGSIESLLHSQLAYMEPAGRPDLFDIKFLRDELLYYSRDENQFLRRRRTFVFALYPDLEESRFKDAELPWQRIVLLLGLTLVAVRKLLEWLSGDALVFEFLFMDEAKDGKVLASEQAILEMVLREQIANGTVIISRMPPARLPSYCQQRSRRSLCHCLTLATKDQVFEVEETRLARLVLAGPVPGLALDDDVLQIPEADDGLGAWTLVLERLLQYWL